MTELSHSVLFTGDDGLPILFNIQNTTEKESLRALIERNGGMCTLSDEAIILVSPGTKVLSVLANKNLVSSSYVFDCVKEYCMLDTDDYKIEIKEVEASDFSDSSNLQANSVTLESSKNLPDDIIDNSIDIIQPVKALSPQNIICSNSNHDFDFQDTENHNTVVEVLKNVQQSNSHLEVALESSENHIHFGVDMNKAGESQGCANAVPDSLENCEQSIIVNQKKSVGEHFCIVENRAASDVEDPVVAVVSSSQENPEALDQFDNMILNKVQEKPVLVYYIYIFFSVIVMISMQFSRILCFAKIFENTSV